MSAIDIKDVQARIVETLDAVERGETLAITRDGQAVALLEPATRRSQEGLPSMAEFRASLGVNEAETNSVIEAREQERY
jgi:antitoxin (DNA-binding transcriptional repressor) of toxin-antitoxin stability system